MEHNGGYSSEPEHALDTDDELELLDNYDLQTAVSEDEDNDESSLTIQASMPAPLSSDDIPLTPVKRKSQLQVLPPSEDIPLSMLWKTSHIRRFTPKLPCPSRRPRSSSVDGQPPLHTPRTERRIQNHEKAQKRLATLAILRENEYRKRGEAEELAQQRRISVFNNALEVLEEGDCSLAEFLEHIFNPATPARAYDWKWHGFFKHKSLVCQTFRHWTSTKSSTRGGRQLVDGWVMERAAEIANKEAAAISRDGFLSKTKKIINEKFFLDYSIERLTNLLEAKAPVFFGIVEAFSMTPRQKIELTGKWLAKKRVMIGSSVLGLLRARSQINNYAQSLVATYLMATGGQRQHFSIFSSLGATIGYGGVIDRRGTEDVAWCETSRDSELDTLGASSSSRTTEKVNKRMQRTKGILTMLSKACRETAREVYKTGLYIRVCDNVNMMVRVAEQVLGRKNAQENGTCATIFPLHNAKREDLEIRKLEESIQKAPLLKVEDLELTEAQSDLLDSALVHTIVSIIVRYGGEGFEKWATDVVRSKPSSAETIAVHQTPIHPLPSMEIDESTITGNVEVVEAMNRELRNSTEGTKEDDPDYADLFSGDQLTISRQRTVTNIRVGHEKGEDSWKHMVLVPGLFHAKIADCHGLLFAHFGVSSIRSPGSLAFHNTSMDRLPIVLTSLPSFRVCRDLIVVSLYSRVLHCLLLVSKTRTLEEYTTKPFTFEDLQKHAKTILERFANADMVQELREPRNIAARKKAAAEKAEKEAAKANPATAKTSAPPKNPPVCEPHQGDEVFENAQLFLRDALFTRLFADAVKAGDSGLVIIVLKIWTHAYRGSGRTKYAHEMLHLFHNLVNVWTKELRSIVIQNWLLNPTGQENAFVEIDLVQEHLNFWIKKVYKADGDAHSWEWLEVVSPCVEVLRKLSTKLNAELGSRQGSKHTTPDLSNDIHTLMNVLEKYDVYQFKKGRMVDEKDAPVPDIQAVGLAALTHGVTGPNPLQEFNTQFERARERRRLVPVARSAFSMPPPPHPSPSIHDSQQEKAVETTPSTPVPDDTTAKDDEDIAVPYTNDDSESLESPTLTRFDEGDVALDMDEFVLDDDEDGGKDDSYGVYGL